jgi:hypothetical protein
LIKNVETAFRDSDHMTIAERKLEVLKQTNRDFSTYYIEFRCNTADVQWNNPAKRTTLMRGLNNEIKDPLTLSDNVYQ